MGHRVECREFLDWALPRMGFRPAGFRRVRGQVCKRIGRRLRALAAKEKQMAKQVDLNLALKRISAELSLAREQL